MRIKDVAEWAMRMDPEALVCPDCMSIMKEHFDHLFYCHNDMCYNEVPYDADGEPVIEHKQSDSDVANEPG